MMLFNLVTVMTSILVATMLQPSPVAALYQDVTFYDAAGPEATSHKCLLRKESDGYIGTGFLDFQIQGAWVEFSVDLPSEASVIVVRYSAGSSDRPVDILIDGAPVGVVVPLKQTDGWNMWEVGGAAIPPINGRHTVRLLASQNSGPNIDFVGFWDGYWFQPIDPAPMPVQAPQPSPVQQPVGEPIRPTSSSYAQTIVLTSRQKLQRGEFVASPSGVYQFGLSNGGDLQLKGPNNKIIWRAGVSSAITCSMQPDGNLIARKSNKAAAWRSKTSGNDGAMLVLDDGGQVAVVSRDTALWLAGVPRGQYSGPPGPSLEFPLRGAFYYPWFPETWTVNGEEVFYSPTLGKYGNGDPDVQNEHVRALEYAHVDVSIASWWGPSLKKDRARITNLMDKSLGTGVKWSVYHEMERRLNQSPSEIRDDLDYLLHWFAWHEAWAHIDGRPVIFVYNEGGCKIAERWDAASNGEWYVVLKTFRGYLDCSVQPDHWHEYGPANAVVHRPGASFAVSPGFWRADLNSAALPRLRESTFSDIVQEMVESGEDWQLITTFNEWGEGTAVESARQWSSASGYGYYMDALHNIH